MQKTRKPFNTSLKALIFKVSFETRSGGEKCYCGTSDSAT